MRPDRSAQPPRRLQRLHLSRRLSLSIDQTNDTKTADSSPRPHVGEGRRTKTPRAAGMTRPRGLAQEGQLPCMTKVTRRTVRRQVPRRHLPSAAATKHDG